MKFKFRAECKHDVKLIKKALKEYILHWKESDVYLDVKPVPHKIPDVDVEFETVENGPSLDEIRVIMNSIQDCHIPTQSINYLESYTGDRYYRDTPQSTMPSIIERLEKEAKDSSITFNRK